MTTVLAHYRREMAASDTFHLRKEFLSHSHELPSAYCL